MTPIAEASAVGVRREWRADRRGIILGSVGLVSQAVFTAGWIAAGTWQPSGYSTIRDTISDLTAKTAPHALAVLLILMFAGLGTAGFALAGLRPALAPARQVAAYAPWFLAFSALGLGNLVSFAQIQCQAYVDCTLHQAMSGFGGAVDSTAGSVVALMAAVAPFPTARRMRNVPGWQWLVRPSLLAGAVTFGCILATGLGTTASVHGLLQRIAATIAAGWTAALAANLIRISRAAAQRQPAAHPPGRDEPADQPE